MSIESNLRFLVDYRRGGDLVTMHKDEARALLAVVDAAKALFGFGYDDPPNSVCFDPHGASEQIAALAGALAELEAEG